MVALATAAGSLSAVPAASAADLPGSLYTPLPSPVRILDTRTGIGGHPGKVGPGETVTLAVPGLPADATAAVINLTGTGGSASTYLSAFPDEFTGTSTLNLTPSQTAAVAAVVTLGPDQSFKIFNHSGTVDVIADLTGYFATEAGSGFTSAPSPARILDTRTSLGGHPGALRPGEVLTLPVRDRAGVPAGATAVAVNLTGVQPSADTFLAVTPDGRPGTSTLNVDSGATRANLAVVGIGPDGAIRVRNNTGSVHVVADVQGWFGPGGGRYVPLPAPYRVLDSREDSSPLRSGAARTVPFVESGVPAHGQVAVLFNLTGVAPTADTYLTAWPNGRPRPLASNLNLRTGSIVPNLAVSATSTVDIYNHAGTTGIVVDAAGYFYTPTRATPTVPGAPTVTAVENAGDRVRVAWSAADDGGLPLTGYTVTAQPGWLSVTVEGSRREVRLPGLVPGIAYTVTVAATNLIGDGPAANPSGPVSPTSMTGADTDAAGNPDPAGGATFRVLSGNGRYVLLSVRSNSNVMPPAYRTPDDQGEYLVRKDLHTGELILASLTDTGRPLRPSWIAAISHDGSTVAYASLADGGPSVLYVRDLVARTVRPVFTAGPGEYPPSNIALSTDGRWLSWSSHIGDAGKRIHRHDRNTRQTTTLLSCDNPDTGCYLSGGPAVAGDATKYLFNYRPTPIDAIRLTLLDTTTATMRPLPEGGSGDGLVLSGDGNWVFYTQGEGCPSCGGGTFQLKKIATTPLAEPVTLRTWEDTVTWTVHPSSADYDGTAVGYHRQTGEGGTWFGAAPGYLYREPSQREIRMPDARTTAYVGAPVISANGKLAALTERCLWGTDCYPTRTYVISLPELQ